MMASFTIFHCFRLSISFLLLFLTLEVTALKPTTRTIWFHRSCPASVKNTAWKDVQDMLRLSNLTTHPDPESDQGRLFRYLFRDNKETSYKFIQEAIGAINIQATPIKAKANTFIYCDQDRRWLKPKSKPNFFASYFLWRKKSPGVKDTAWYDPENHISWEPPMPPHLQVPACRKEALLMGAVGQTYCNVEGLGKGDHCSITLCPVQILWDKVAFSQADVGVDIARTTRAEDVDRYAFLSETILHEIAHTLENEYTNSRWKDVRNAYRWSNVADPTRGGAVAKSNAENLAYWGLGNLIMARGYSIGKNGGIYHKGYVPKVYVKRMVV